MNSRLTGILILSYLSAFFASAFASERVLRCKYSVRDVAFVNVHGKSWQLDLIKPESANQSDFDDWNRILKQRLEPTNLGYAWHDRGSTRANQLAMDGLSPSLPSMALSNDKGVSIPLSLDEANFENRIDQIVQSPIRKQLTDQLTESLCVFLIIEGSDESKNASVKEIVVSAVEQIDRQMWMMEKASDKGPTIVQVDATDPTEQVTLRSIGIDTASDTFPSVAILFGQGRLLGDVLAGDEIKKEKLVALASICGSDCECELDREWLYGSQMVHTWTSEHERIAEDSLEFDPKSAFIMAEISQILQKNSRDGVANNRINMGPGLVMHDLDEVETEEVEAEGPVVSSPVETKTEASSNIQPEHEIAESLDYDSDVPWFLFAGLAVVAAFVVILKLQQK